ncbi:hypothetical protein HK102_004474, partial [Quaeritorhiza haematococci]
MNPQPPPQALSSPQNSLLTPDLKSPPTQRSPIPPEIVGIIVDLIGPDKHSLTTCALLNRTWTLFARPKLWSRPRTVILSPESFLCRLHTALFGLLPDPAAFLTKLEFHITKRSLNAFCEVLPRMKPRLKYLTLLVSGSYRGVLEVVAEKCPKTVVRLQVERFIVDPEVYDAEKDDVEEPDGPLDAVKLGRFFSQFLEIRWVGRVDNADLIQCSAHGGLRSTELVQTLSEEQIGRFISSCSSALVVANFKMIECSLTDEHLLLLGRTCPHLQALSLDWDLNPVPSDAAVQKFFGMVGGTLEYLELIISAWSVHTIAVHQCRKLAHLFLHINHNQVLEVSDDFLDLIRELGPKLKTVRFRFLDEHDWESIGTDLVSVIVEKCPNIEGVSLSHPRIRGSDASGPSSPAPNSGAARASPNVHRQPCSPIFTQPSSLASQTQQPFSQNWSSVSRNGTKTYLDAFCEVLPQMQPALKYLTLLVSGSYRGVVAVISETCPKTVVRLQVERSRVDL